MESFEPLWRPGEPEPKVVDVTTLQDACRKHQHEEPKVKVLDGGVEIDTINLGRLEIRPTGSAPWACEVLLDGKPVEKVLSFTLTCRVADLPRLTLEMFV